MTYWADNIKFIKDILESKYKKLDDAISEIEEHTKALNDNKDNKKIRELFVESARVLELFDPKEMETLAETMFKDMPDKERGEEVDRLKGYVKRYEDGLAKATEGRKKFDIK